MYIYYDILEIFYYIITVAIVALVGWRTVATKKLSNKFIGMFTLLMFALRLFLVR